MPIMTDAGFKEDDWSRIADGDAAGESAIVPIDALASQWEALTERSLRIGVAVANDADLEPLKPYLASLALVVLNFPSFADGRAFSQARRLRTMGYGGRLRASGKIVADQYAYARRVGFDEVEVDDAIAMRQPEAQWLLMARSQSLAYQRVGDGPRNILEARRVAAESARIAAE